MQAPVADLAFQQVFKHLLVYNILFEDSEVDEQFLGIDERSTVLGISGAGCRIAGHLSQHPRRLDAVDMNRHHLALTGLKVSAARSLESYGTFYDLFGRGWHPDPEPIVQRLAAPLPEWMARRWRANHGLFARGLHARGLTARLFAMLRRLAGVDEGWLRMLIALAPERRRQLVRSTFEPVLRRPWVRGFLESPAHLVAVGVNHAQRKRMLETEGTPDIVGFLLMHLDRVAMTDLARNWFAWHSIVGHFNHEDERAVPPYLRRDRHERSLRAPTEVAFHPRDILDVLDEAGPRTWSHFTLCDAPDWMPHAVQKRLFDAVLRASRDGGVMHYRTVEAESLVMRHGLEKHLVPMREETAKATALDRTRQFRGVRYYRIVH
jgi:S-adenosylmethionine-diacylglycerol 3-amino-3-carboxypropyl transferase